MANKANDELKKDQGNPAEDSKEKETPETKPEETEGEKDKKPKKEREPWSTKKKVGVGGTALLTLFGIGCWIKKKFFDGNGDDEDAEE